MAPLLRHALLLPVLTATLVATAIAGRSGLGPLGLSVAATTTTSPGQQDSLAPTERASKRNLGKEDPGALLHTSPQLRDEHQREVRERLRRRRRRQRREEQDQQQGEGEEEEEGRMQHTRWTSRPRPQHRSDNGNNDGKEDGRKNAGRGDGVHGRDDDSARRRGPLDVLAAIGDGIKARAKRPLLAVPEIGAQQQQQQRRRCEVGWIGGEEVAVGCRNQPLAFGNPLARDSGQEVAEVEEEDSAERSAVQAENDASVEAVLSVIESDGWEYVTNKSGVTVVRKFLPPPPKASSGGGVVDEGAAAKFACVKAMGTLDAEASELYKLFLDNERVHEYNDNCKELRDVEQLTKDTKVSWASTPRYGPFKSRDFVTAVHYRTLEDGTMMVVNRPVEHPSARRSKKFVRAEILIATNIMRPNRDDPSKTDFISVTHINPGGIADTTLGAKVVNKLCAKAPVNLLVALERSANSAPVPKKGKAVQAASG